MANGIIMRLVGGTNSIATKIWEVRTDSFDVFGNLGSHFTADAGTIIGEPNENSEGTDNAYIPVVNIDETSNNVYGVYTHENKTWTLSEDIQQDLRKPKSKNIKFKSEDKLVKIKFNVNKGNQNANDNDGGKITAKFFDVDDEFIKSKIFEDLKYGDNFELEWDKSKNIGQIDFYADDTDFWGTDGGVSNVFCGAIKYGSKVGRTLTKNIENLPIAKPSEHLPNTSEYTYGHPQESIDIANKFQNCLGMCFAVSMARVGKAFQDCKINDAIKVAIKGEDYIYSGTVLKNIPDEYFGYGVGGALTKNGYAELLSHEDVWAGKLEEGAMLQYWNNYNEKDWMSLKSAIKLSMGKSPAQWHPDFNAGHSVIFKSYNYDTGNKIIGIKYYDYHGIETRGFNKGDKKMILGANLKDTK